MVEFRKLSPEEVYSLQMERYKFSELEAERLRTGESPSIFNLNLSARVHNTLAKRGAETIRGVEEILESGNLPVNFGPKAMEETQRALEGWHRNHPTTGTSQPALTPRFPGKYPR